MMKALGTLMILSSGGYTLLHYHRRSAEHEKKLQELILSLEYITTEIRWKHRRLPEIFEGLSANPYYGDNFLKIVNGLKRHKSLQELIHQAFSCLDKEQFSIIEGLRLSGDEKQITEEVLYAAGCLKKILQNHRNEKKEKGRIITALVCCFTGFLVILLI